MKTNWNYLGSTLGLICLVVGSVEAQQTGGVKIHGDLTKTTAVGKSSNIALGSQSYAKTSIGSLENGVVVKGRVRVDVDVEEATNIADGPNETAVISVGTIHSGSVLSGDVVVSTGKIENITNGSGEASCVIIGSKGSIPECDGHDR